MNTLKKSHISFLLLTGLFFCFGTIVHAALQMHLPLDGNLNDISGNSNNGAFRGGSTNPGFAAAVYNQGLNFDGNNDYITVPSFDPGSTFSASLWVNHDNIGALNTFIEHVNNGNNRNDFYIGYDNSNNQLTVELEDNNQYEGGACGNPKFCTGISLNSNRWYHVVVTVTPTTLNVYIDTTLAYTVTHSTTVNFGNGSWLLGGDTDNNPVTSANNDYLDGRLDDVRIYNHELSQIEISALYGLIAEWNFDSCNVTAPNGITDSSGNGYHATGNNGLTTATGRICTAGSFDGNNDYASLPGFPNLNTSFTISSWINPNAINSDQRIFADDESNSNGFAFSLGDGGNGRLRLFSRNVSPISLDSSAVISTGSWYHVVAVHDSINKTRQIFVNGVDATGGPRAYTGTWGSDNGLASIGGETDGAGSEANANWRFNGLIDEVRVYNRALSTEEINGYYTNPDPLNRTCPACNTLPICTTTNTLSQKELKGISGSSDNNVIAAGKNGEVYIYDGSNWSGPITITGNSGEDLEDVSVINSTSSIVVGKKGTVLVQNNNVWSSLTTPNGEDLRGVWAYSPTDFYVFGKKGTAYHYNSGAWNDLSATTNNKDFEEAWGDTNAVYGLTKKGVIHTFTRPANTPSSNNTCDTASGDDFKSFWGDGSGSFYLAGKKGEIRKFDGVSNCSLITTASENLEGIYGSSVTGDIYAVGKKGVLVKNGTPTWSESTVANGEDLKAVWVSDSGTPYYAGKKGSITVCSSLSSIHHIEFIHDGSALTCNPEQITVKACKDNLSPCTPYTSQVTVGLLPTGWVGGDSKSFINVTGSANYNLQHTTAGVVTLATSSVAPAASNPVVCKDIAGNITNCNMTFNDSGFIFDVTTQTSCTTSPNIKISAVRKDFTTQQCVPFFNGKTAALKLWTAYSNPTTGTRQATLNYSSTDYPLATTSPGTDINMAFDTNGEASFTLNYPDAGELDLNATYTGSAATSDAGLNMGGNKKYVTVPAKLYVYSDDTNAACASNDGACSAFKPAGSAADSQFNLKVRAACADNTVTPNFALNNITVAHTNTAPAVAQGSIAVTSFNMATADNGDHTITNQAVSEVGSFTFTATSPNYLGVTGPSGTSAYIGRFYPHHFDTTVAQSCGTFSYSGQNISVTATAQNNWLATPTSTQNYTGSFAYNTTLSNVGDASNFTQNIILDTSFSNGTANKTDVIYTFPTKETLPLTITLRANDADTGSATGLTEGTTEIRSGRTRVENAYGSELVDMAVPATVEYYNTNGFELNTADNCSVVSAILTDIGTDPIQIGAGLAGETCIWDDDAESGTNNCTNAAILPGPVSSQFESPAVAGSFNLFLLAPGANNTGDIGVTLVSPIWLQYDWDGDGNHDNDPFGTASFGLYRGDDRIIYWREVF